jgi:hypothetical protein
LSYLESHQETQEVIVEQCPQLADIGYLQLKGGSSTTRPFLPRPASLFAPLIWNKQAKALVASTE